MLELEDWIVESEIFKTCFRQGSALAAEATWVARETRSELASGQGMTRRNVFSAFAWRI